MSYVFTPFQLEWLAALKSDKFEQTSQGELVSLFFDEQNVINKRKYCCLGVACVLVDSLRGTMPELPTLSYQEKDETGSFEGETSWLPKNMIPVLKLRNEQGALRQATRMFSPERYKDEDFLSLGEMNDAGITFKDIAAYIEANPENVFLS